MPDVQAQVWEFGAGVRAADTDQVCGFDFSPAHSAGDPEMPPVLPPQTLPSPQQTSPDPAKVWPGHSADKAAQMCQGGILLGCPFPRKGRGCSRLRNAAISSPQVELHTTFQPPDSIRPKP